MERSYGNSRRSSLKARGLAAALVLIVAVSAFLVSLSRFDSASAHCDSVDGPVVTAAKAALEADDVTLVLPYVKPDAEAELTAAFEHTMAVRAHGGEIQDLPDRYFFETAVRLHRAGESAPYTGLKAAVEPDPALKAAEWALDNGSLDQLYAVLDESIQAGVQERYQAVVDAREHEASEGTVASSRARVEAELEFELYIHGIGQAVVGGDAHAEGTPAEAGGHKGQGSPPPHKAARVTRLTLAGVQPGTHFTVSRPASARCTCRRLRVDLPTDTGKWRLCGW